MKHHSPSCTFRVLIPVLALAVGAISSGCRSSDDDRAARSRNRDRPPAGEERVDDVMSVNHLETAGVPVEVRPIILNDLNGATISSARATPTGDGLIYRVVYYRPDGSVAEAMYDDAGQRMAVPATLPRNDVNSSGDTTGGPPVTPPPSTRPAGDLPR